MDSKFLKVTLLVSLLFMTTIFFVVLYSNGIGPGQKKESTQSVETVVQDVVLSGQIGNDLYGWMEDETFFDEVKKVELDEEGAIRVNLIATSVEKDMRVRIVGPDGKPRKYPWYIEIENGTGIPQKTQIGGTYCQANSFQSATKVFANLSDLDFFKLFCDADKYITAWELAHAPALIRNARKVIEENSQNNQQ